MGTFNQIRTLFKIRDLWIGLFILKAGFSLLLIIPFYLVNNSVLSSSHFSGSLINNWDFSVISEMFFGRGELVAAFILFIFIGLIIYIALMQFINGGLYYLFVSGRTDVVATVEEVAANTFRVSTWLDEQLPIASDFMFVAVWYQD